MSSLELKELARKYAFGRGSDELATVIGENFMMWRVALVELREEAIEKKIVIQDKAKADMITYSTLGDDDLIAEAEAGWDKRLYSVDREILALETAIVELDQMFYARSNSEKDLKGTTERVKFLEAAIESHRVLTRKTNKTDQMLYAALEGKWLFPKATDSS